VWQHELASCFWISYDFGGEGFWVGGWMVGGWKRPCNRIRPTELVAGRARVCRIGGCKGGSGRVAGGT